MEKGRKVGSVVCGGNIDVRILAGVLTRGLVRDGRMVRLRIDISDRPGVLAKLADIIGRAGGNIIGHAERIEHPAFLERSRGTRAACRNRKAPGRME